MVSSAITGAGSVSAQDSRVNQTTKSKDSGTDFSAVLSKSVAGNLSESNKNTSSKMSASVVSTQTDKTTKTSGDTSSSKTNKTSASDKSTSNAKDTKTTDTSKSQSDDKTQKIVDKADEAGRDVADKIKEDFGVTDEQLTQAMEALGLTFADLLVPNNINQLVVAVTDSQNIMDIVTDENLSNSLMDVLDFAQTSVADLAAQVEMPVEDIQELIKNVDTSVSTAVVQNVTDETRSSAKTVETTPQETVAEDTANKEETSVSDVIAKKLTVNNEESGNESDAKNDGNALNADTKSDGENITSQTGNVVNNIQEAFETAFEQADYNVNTVDVVDQVIESIKLNNTTELKSMEIQLNPQNLGKVNLQVSIREGVVTAQITAENEQVRKALESQITTLKENIQNQGIKVDAVEVTVQSHSFEANQQFAGEQQAAEQGRRSSRRIRLDGFGADDEDDETDDTVIDYNENSSVEFTA